MNLRVADHIAWAAETGTDRRPGAVDHRLDAARSVQEYGQQIVEGHAGDVRRLEGHRVLDRDTLVKEAVAAQAVAGERGHAVRHEECRVTVLSRTRHPGRLAWHLVRVAAVPAVAPPIRKNTSSIETGSLA